MTSALTYNGLNQMGNLAVKLVGDLNRASNLMGLSTRDMELIQAVQYGLPVSARPYADVGKLINMDEAEVISRLEKMLESGVIKRLGVVVHHRKLGYQANAMVVWNIPDEEVTDAGLRISQFAFVTLCYQRPRRLPQWPYNLFSMIHGSDREAVTKNTRTLAEECQLQDIPYEILFSNRCFKQRGAVYHPDKSSGRN